MRYSLIKRLLNLLSAVKDSYMQVAVASVGLKGSNSLINEQVINKFFIQPGTLFLSDLLS